MVAMSNLPLNPQCLAHESLINVCQKNEGREFPGSPVVKTHTSNAGDKGSIPRQGTKIPYAMQYGQKKKQTPGTKSLCTNRIFITLLK